MTKETCICQKEFVYKCEIFRKKYIFTKTNESAEKNQNLAKNRF